MCSQVPDEAVMNMKANFVLPDIGETYFKEVLYTELGPQESATLVSQYNAEATAAGFSMTGGVKGFVKRNAKQREREGNFDVIGKVFIEDDQSAPPPDSMLALNPTRAQSPPRRVQQQQPWSEEPSTSFGSRYDVYLCNFDELLPHCTLCVRLQALSKQERRTARGV